MPFILEFHLQHILNLRSMNFIPAKVTFNGFAITFEILSAHCAIRSHTYLLGKQLTYLNFSDGGYSDFDDLYYWT